METNWAADHLQTIRTLMERSALYRRALAPIMIWCGVLGSAAGIAGWLLKLDHGFFFFWNGVALLALTGSFLLVRRQALKDSEPFWSPPTRRVAQALFVPLFVGCFVSTLFSGSHSDSEILGAAFWASFYGCALHSAGFFMSRGIKLFGWIFIVVGCLLFLLLTGVVPHPIDISPHLLMGGIFGGLHLAYGIYLYFTEKRKNAT